MGALLNGMPVGVRSWNRGIKTVEPMKLEEYSDRYGTDKRRALQEIMTSLEDSVREMLSRVVAFDQVDRASGKCAVTASSFVRTCLRLMKA